MIFLLWVLWSYSLSPSTFILPLQYYRPCECSNSVTSQSLGSTANLECTTWLGLAPLKQELGTPGKSKRNSSLQLHCTRVILARLSTRILTSQAPFPV